jgi:hypothetical protein
MSEQEFQQARELYASGGMSRRRFVGRMVAAGMSAVAAVAFADAFTNTVRASGHSLYGSPKPGLYGTPPGKGGTNPGKGGGTPPGKKPSF